MADSKPTLLIIEDDLEAAQFLVKGLTESGYVVDHAEDGASEQAARHVPAHESDPSQR